MEAELLSSIGSQEPAAGTTADAPETVVMTAAREGICEYVESTLAFRRMMRNTMQRDERGLSTAKREENLRTLLQWLVASGEIAPPIAEKFASEVPWLITFACTPFADEAETRAHVLDHVLHVAARL